MSRKGTATFAPSALPAPARARLAAGVAGVLLIGASVFGGALAANATPPTPPVIVAPSDGQSVPARTAITVSGTAESNVIVDVIINGAVACSSPTTVGTTWSCSVGTLAPGSYLISATATHDPDGATDGPSGVSRVNITVDSPPFAIDYPVDSSTINTLTPEVSGTGPALGSVDVQNGSGSLCTALVDAGGNWACTPPDGSFVSGQNSIYALGPNEQSDHVTFNIELPPGVPAITDPAGASTTYNGSWSVGGIIPDPDPNGPNRTIVVTAVTGGETREFCTTTVFAGDSFWSCDGGLNVGDNSFTAVAGWRDEGGAGYNFSAPSNAAGPITYLGPIPKPDMAYDIEPGALTATATSNAIGADKTDEGGNPIAGGAVQWYAPTPNGEGYNFGTAIANCPGDQGGDVYLGGGPTVVCGVDATPGIWEAYSRQVVDYSSSDLQDDYFLVPEIPTIASRVNEDRSVTIYGTGMPPGSGIGAAPSYAVLVQTPEGAPVCTAGVTSAGTWSCTVEASQGNHSYRATQTSQGWSADPLVFADNSYQGLSPYSSTTSVTVPAAPVVVGLTPIPTPTPTVPPLVWKLFSDGKTQYEPGDPYKFTGSGLPSGVTVDAVIHSTPRSLGSTVVGADGSFTLTGTIPEDIEPGSHTVIVTVTQVDGSTSAQQESVTVVPHPVAKVSPPRNDPHPATLASASADRSDPATPSSFTHPLDTLAQILSNPVVIGAAALGGIALLLFVAFPAELLNATISEHYERLTRRIPGLKRRPDWLARFLNLIRSTPIVGGVVVTIIAAIIFGFADPGAGFDITTMRVMLACAIALFIVGFIANTVAGLVIARRWQLDTVMELKPLALVLTIIGVVISRLLEFSPGLLIGLLLGIAVLGRPTKAQEGKAALLKAGIVYALAVAAWLVYSIVPTNWAGDSFGGNLTLETLVSVTSEGLTALLIGMLPFRFLEGEVVWKYSKLAWTLSYLLIAASFALIVLPASWGTLSGSIWVWGSVVVAFTVVAVLVYCYFRYWSPSAEQEEPEEAERETVEAR
jgi:hypothetical protein